MATFVYRINVTISPVGFTTNNSATDNNEFMLIIASATTGTGAATAVRSGSTAMMYASVHSGTTTLYLDSQTNGIYIGIAAYCPFSNYANTVSGSKINPGGVYSPSLSVVVDSQNRDRLLLDSWESTFTNNFNKPSNVTSLLASMTSSTIVSGPYATAGDLDNAFNIKNGTTTITNTSTYPPAKWCVFPKMRHSAITDEDPTTAGYDVTSTSTQVSYTNMQSKQVTLQAPMQIIGEKADGTTVVLLGCYSIPTNISTNTTGSFPWQTKSNATNVVKLRFSITYICPTPVYFKMDMSFTTIQVFGPPNSSYTTLTGEYSLTGPITISTTILRITS